MRDTTLSTTRHEPQILISGPLSVGALLDRAFRLYRSRFRSFVAISGVLLLPSSLIASIVTGSYTINIFRVMAAAIDSPSAYQVATAANRASGIAPLFVNFGAWLVMLLSTLALISLALTVLRGGTETLGQSVRNGWGRLFSTTGMEVLRWLGFAGLAFAIAIMAWGAMVVFFLIFGGLGERLGNDDSWLTGVFILIMGVLGVGIVLVTFIALFAPIVYLYARWLVAAVGIVDQHWRAGQSLRESWRLTKGNSLRVIGFSILLGILGFVMMSLPYWLAEFLLFTLVPVEGYALAAAIPSVLAAVLQTLWQPIFAIALVLLYFDLRVRREGYDITLRIEAMESEQRVRESLEGVVTQGSKDFDQRLRESLERVAPESVEE